MSPGPSLYRALPLLRPLRHDYHGHVLGHGPQWQEQLQVCGGLERAGTQMAVGLGVPGKACPERFRRGARARCGAGAPAGPGLWACGSSRPLPAGLAEGGGGRAHPGGLRGHPGAATCPGEGGAGAAETRPGRSVRPRRRRRTKKGGDSPPRRAATARGRGAPRPSARLSPPIAAAPAPLGPAKPPRAGWGRAGSIVCAARPPCPPRSAGGVRSRSVRGLPVLGAGAPLPGATRGWKGRGRSGACLQTKKTWQVGLEEMDRAGSGIRGLGSHSWGGSCRFPRYRSFFQ